MSSQQVESNSSLPPDEVIFGHSRQLQELSQMVDRVASANVPVLIQGESGTGKEIFAKLVHRRSPWHDGPSVSTHTGLHVRVEIKAVDNLLQPRAAQDFLDHDLQTFLEIAGDIRPHDMLGHALVFHHDEGFGPVGLGQDPTDTPHDCPSQKQRQQKPPAATPDDGPIFFQI